MADKKISQLPASTVPLAGTEVLPIVQGGVTDQVSVANLTAGRAVSATQYTSTIATGTPPLVVASTTEVANLKSATATVADSATSANAVKSNATTGLLQVTGPAAASTRVMTTPDSDFAVLYSGGALGTPSSGTLTSCTGLPVSTGVSGLGANVATALAVAVGSAGAPVVNGGVLGTPSSGTLTNCTFPTLNQSTTGSSGSVKSNATTGVLQVTGPAAASTRVMTTPDANFTVARTDAAQTFTGKQTFGEMLFGAATPTMGSNDFEVFNTGGKNVGSNPTSTLFTLPSADTSTCGIAFVSCYSSGGVRFDYIIYFYRSNGTFTATALATGNSQGTTTATISLSGSDVIITMTYNGGVGGALYYSVAGFSKTTA